MFKKTVSIVILICLALSLASCGGGSSKLDDVSKETVVGIEDYLGEAGSYFQLADSSLIISDTADKAEVFDAYIKAANAVKDLPAELVNSYVESFKAGIEESVDEEEIKTVAKDLIKEEMVISLAYTALKCDAITDEMRTAKATEIAAELDCDVAAIYTAGGNTYIVDTAVKEDLVKAKLESAWDKAHA